jgi:hypothetical protein
MQVPSIRMGRPHPSPVVESASLAAGQAPTVHLQACDRGPSYIRQFSVEPTTRECHMRVRGKTTCHRDALEQGLLVEVSA